jgi:hypothetical protein
MTGSFEWTYHAMASVHQDYSDTTKTYYNKEIDVKKLILDSMKHYDALIQHREYTPLVWILKDFKENIGLDLKTQRKCTKIVILVNAYSFRIITHMPVWEYGCANV